MVRSTVYSTRVSQECPVMKSGLLASAGRPGNANTTYQTCLPRLRSKRLLLRSKPGGFVNRPTSSSKRNWDSTISKGDPRSEEHTSELQSLMRISYAVFCLKKKKK